MEKRELRGIVRELKRRYTHDELIAMSRSVVSALEERIMKTDGCTTILLYHSMPDEVYTHELIINLHSKGKKVLLPTVVGEDLELHEYEGEGNFATSRHFSIQESTGSLFTNYDQIDLAVIPGMAFTLQGDRLGRGKGFYDRLLPKIKCPLIGLAFPFQIVDTIPCESHDIKMSEVITHSSFASL